MGQKCFFWFQVLHYIWATAQDLVPCYGPQWWTSLKSDLICILLHWQYLNVHLVMNFISHCIVMCPGACGHVSTCIWQYMPMYKAMYLQACGCVSTCMWPCVHKHECVYLHPCGCGFTLICMNSSDNNGSPLLSSLNDHPAFLVPSVKKIATKLLHPPSLTLPTLKGHMTTPEVCPLWWNWQSWWLLS